MTTTFGIIDQGLPLESNGGVPVNIQDQTTRPIALRMNKVIQTGLTLATDTVTDSRTITLSPGHGLTAGNYIILLEEVPGDIPCYFYLQIINVATNTIYMDTLMPKVFTAAGCQITQYDPELNKDGSVTVYKAELRNPFTTAVDVTRLIFHIMDQSAMDDALFGGRGALTYGVALRKNDPASGNNCHYWNVKTNGAFGELSFSKTYEAKAPAGYYGFTARITYAGQDKHGVAIRLEQGQALELLIQDDLTALDKFHVTVEGHFVQG